MSLTGVRGTLPQFAHLGAADGGNAGGEARHGLALVLAVSLIMAGSFKAVDIPSCGDEPVPCWPPSACPRPPRNTPR